MSLISNGPGMATTTTITTTTTIYTTPSFSFGANTPASQNSKPLAFNLSQPKFNFSLTPNTSGKGILGPGPSNAALVSTGGTATPLSTISPQGTPVTQATAAATPFFSFSMTPSQPGASTTPADSSKGLTPNLGVAKSPDSADDGYYVNRDGEDSHIKFDPIMPLPDKVEVRTGEEDERCLFEHRAKLYRFDSSEWKERGLGNIKILENTQTQKLRLVMRREQVLKVCCNHYITADVDLKPKVNSKGCAWVWCAFDSSDGGEAQLQHLSIRFKTAEIANNFKDSFEEAKQKAIAYQKSPEKDKENSTDGACTNTDPQTPTISPTVKGPKSDAKRSSVATTLFPDPDYKNLDDDDDDNEAHKDEELSNEDDVIFIKQVEATPEQVERARKLMLPDHFYLYETKEPCRGCRGCDPEDLKKSPKQTYAAKAALSVSERHKPQSPQSPASSTVADVTVTSATTTTANTTAITTTTTTTTTFPADSSTSSMPFSRLMNNTEYSGMLFSTLAAQANTQETTAFQKDKNKPFSWQGAGQKLFDVKSSPGAAHNDDEDDDDVVANVDIHFDPVIELPALIDRKSGEEDETPLFVQRSKLYRFDKSLNCWKEKGIGNMKILSHNGSVRFRLLFRREQVLKVACNHLLTTNLVLKRMFTSETAWCWVARDYTDEKEGTVEQFAVRFKTVELASSFHKCFTECQEKLLQEESQVAGSGTAPADVQGLSNTLSNLNVELQNTSVEGSEEAKAVEHSEEGEDEEEKDDNEAEEVDVRFEKRATLYYKVDKDWVSLGLGNLQVEYDATVGGLRIVMTDSSDKPLCNHIITRETNFTQCASKHKHSGTWASMDEASGESGQRTFRLDFSSAAAYSEFKDVFQQGKTMAKEMNISEQYIYST
ncbi:E3 SUMO-protein ligase RanBP2 isoform X1 [Octopus sinensis]|uniref:E3 SUMO-protein ligase RanBP2 isoform X1 n=1 Tax=Octopus sinensis TaxID=2607531 RepID=A0A6P7TM35_9MOLL|nr:E3 SUMO-protein ligase RanBP2 isoform X1 [Octopus sinensis]